MLCGSMNKIVKVWQSNEQLLKSVMQWDAIPTLRCTLQALWSIPEHTFTVTDHDPTLKWRMAIELFGTGGRNFIKFEFLCYLPILLRWNLFSHRKCCLNNLNLPSN